MTYMNGHDRFYGLAWLFYVDNEQNIPTFFSVFLLLFAALLLLIIAVLERNRTASHVLHWAILSLGFLYIAADEFIALHERLVKPMRKLLGDGNLGVFYFAWVIPGMALVPRPRDILPEILAASSCENEAHFLDGRDLLHRGLYRFRAYRGPLR